MGGRSSWHPIALDWQPPLRFDVVNFPLPWPRPGCDSQRGPVAERRRPTMDLPITPTLSLPERELRWQAVRSSGPGGQNVNKVSTKVELRFRVHESSLPEPVRLRLAQRVRTRLTSEGDLVLTCDETRSQLQNLERARAKLAELIRAALAPPRRRRATRPTRAAVARRLDDKARTKEKKAARRAPSDS